MTEHEMSAEMFAAEKGEPIEFNKATEFENEETNADTGKQFLLKRKSKMACLYFPKSHNTYTAKNHYYTGVAPDGVGL
ncbi:MAG: hypothetical protein H8D23_16635 [Candidatus Brocadiales bacterium]|nr:hypothetical protein [Candidatus Brocadiales bacterium]